MDEIQKTLIAAGREDLVQQYLEKTGAGIEGHDKTSFDYIDTTVEIGTAPVGDRAFKVLLHTNTKDGSSEYMCNYPDEIVLGKQKAYRMKVKQEMFDNLLALANKFDIDFQKTMKEYNLIRIKS
jgi:hypothetical protein